MNKLRIGLFGFGVVGEGIYQVLSQRPNMDCEIVKIGIKDSSKKRNAPANLFTTQANEILDDSSINVVVELINDTEEALRIVTKALSLGKSVVSANKKMIAENHADLIQLQRENEVSFLYEAAVGGSIPIIRNLEEYFDNDPLRKITGIVNGSTNYILTKMQQDGICYSEGLASAQNEGFAESDPSLDVEGVDACHKLSIMCLHAFGEHRTSCIILRKGITSITPNDLRFAKEEGLIIKLIANTQYVGSSLCSTVLPTFLKKGSTLSTVDDEYNGVLIESSLSDEQFLSGKGAGRFPTSSAVLSDISALKFGYKYAFRKGTQIRKTKVLGSKKFYVSFEDDQPFDKEVFDTIDKGYKSGKFNFIIGDIELSNLAELNLLDETGLSIIAFG